MKNHVFISGLFVFVSCLFYSSPSSSNVLYEMTALPKKSPLWEIKAVLEDPLIPIKEDTQLILVFSLAEKRRLEIKCIQTQNKEIEEIVRTKLQNLIIHEKRLKGGTPYEVKIDLKASA